MILLQEPFLSDTHDCPYLPGQRCRYEYFFAIDVNSEELSHLLEEGWRKFGAYFFRPNCPGCRKCIPLRVLVPDFSRSKSQRRVQRKGSAVSVYFGPLRYSNRIYEIYQDHSLTRFGRKTEKEDFISSFYTQSCPMLQSEYSLDNKLIAAGFLDRGSNSLSSVYFIFDTQYAHLRLGTLSVLKEIDYARSLGLEYYYLGYWIRQNRSMAYKNRFYPQEQYDWESGKWRHIANDS
ncbi:MAG TPA: arginyltransferase [Spirochaetota bacterium]|nr:arginyltransferase [Spirochaetota bacterium]HPI89721.1 arginyltransferase [Spirochaetota bacterium]HPR46646.1 arginyltransferase [Spirochaetota bacterium]